jgi:hypothetical protein
MGFDAAGTQPSFERERPHAGVPPRHHLNGCTRWRERAMRPDREVTIG